MLSDCSQFAVRLPKEIREKVREEARRRLVSQSDVVREAVLDYFAKRTQQPSEETAQ